MTGWCVVVMSKETGKPNFVSTDMSVEEAHKLAERLQNQDPQIVSSELGLKYKDDMVSGWMT